MSRSKAISHTRQQLDDLAPGALFLADPVFERSALDEFGDEVLTFSELSHIMNGQDVRMIERGRHLRLALETPSAGSVGDTVAQELDRDWTIQLGVVRAIDGSHSSFTKRRLNTVGTDTCS
jgi:hypothetical protein